MTSSERPLSKSRLHEILACFEPGVTIQMRGGYDTGVYFLFKGKALRRIPHDKRIIGGRIVREDGFCSEALLMTHEEKFSRGGSKVGIEMFMARCEERRIKFERWLTEFNALLHRREEPPSPSEGLFNHPSRRNAL